MAAPPIAAECPRKRLWQVSAVYFTIVIIGAPRCRHLPSTPMLRPSSSARCLMVLSVASMRIIYAVARRNAATAPFPRRRASDVTMSPPIRHTRHGGTRTGMHNVRYSLLITRYMPVFHVVDILMLMPPCCPHSVSGMSMKPSDTGYKEHMFYQNEPATAVYPRPQSHGTVPRRRTRFRASSTQNDLAFFDHSDRTNHDSVLIERDTGFRAEK